MKNTKGLIIRKTTSKNSNPALLFSIAFVFFNAYISQQETDSVLLASIQKYYPL